MSLIGKHLAIYTLADFARLPYADVKRRLGEQAATLYQTTIEENILPLQPIRTPLALGLRIGPAISRGSCEATSPERN